jgi:CBS domain-containing protein
MPRISELMTREVEVITPDESLQRAAQLMDDLNVGALPVCDGNRLVGMVTDRDITVRATAIGLDPNETEVSAVMTEETRWCRQDQSADEVLQLMGEAQIRRLPVLDDNERVVGIVSLGDLAASGSDLTDEALRRISAPEDPQHSVA